MIFSERVLMGPGPCNPYPAAVSALSRPMLGHLDPEFIGVLDETGARLRKVFGTANTLTFPVSGTGSAGMEAAFVNFVEPGDVVVVGVNGVFGLRMVDVATRCGAEVIAVEAEWGQPLDPQQVLDAHPSPKIIAIVHAETSTGVRNDLTVIGAGKGEALFLVDCVTSLGGMPTELDTNRVDIAYAGTQKCLGTPPGLAPVSISPRAAEALVDKPRSWYLDLHQIARYVSGDGARAYHHTAPISMVFSLHAGLGTVLDEGIEQCHARHKSEGEALQRGLERMGMELFVAEANRLPQLTSVRVPFDRIRAGMTEADVRFALLDKYGIEIGGALGPMAGQVWRIGLMGHTARSRNVTLLLGALQEILD